MQIKLKNIVIVVHYSVLLNCKKKCFIFKIILLALLLTKQYLICFKQAIKEQNELYRQICYR